MRPFAGGVGCRKLNLLVLGMLTLAGCDGGIAGPPPRAFGGTLAAAAPNAGVEAVVRWNEIARDLVAEHSVTPPLASRVYALLSVTQHEAMLALAQHPRMSVTGAAPLHAPAAAVVAASAATLSSLFPGEASALTARSGEEIEVLRRSAPRVHDEVADAIALGERTAAAVLDRARTDGADAVWSGSVPTGPGFWFSSVEPPQPPLLPLWGSVRPWFMSSGSQFRPPAPPAFGSPAFLNALAEVRHYSDHRTAEQLRIAHVWADGPATYTPPGHWNEIATALIRAYHLDARRATRVLAYMNMAIMDAGISCWDAKYTYWLIRPSQVDPRITTPVGLPNFPAYTSGHATFSGAAGEVLGHFFAAERARLRAMAEEAAVSRLYGGIHYRFDSDRGLEAGRAIGRLAIEAERQRAR